MDEANQSEQVQQPDAKLAEKELNFRKQQAMYERMLADERSARLEAERIAKEANSKRQVIDEEEEEDDSSEPYVDKRKLQKTLAKYGQQAQQQTQTEIQKAVKAALSDERKSNWLRNNKDFEDVLQHADKLAEKDPELAEAILEMPNNFERQKLVYNNIKALGLHKPKELTPIQSTIDANRRTPGYQPSGVGANPFSMGGDMSPQGQKQAYEKLLALKSRISL